MQIIGKCPVCNDALNVASLNVKAVILKLMGTLH